MKRSHADLIKIDEKQQIKTSNMIFTCRYYDGNFFDYEGEGNHFYSYHLTKDHAVTEMINNIIMFEIGCPERNKSLLKILDIKLNEDNEDNEYDDDDYITKLLEKDSSKCKIINNFMKNGFFETNEKSSYFVMEEKVNLTKEIFIDELTNRINKIESNIPYKNLYSNINYRIVLNSVKYDSMERRFKRTIIKGKYNGCIFLAEIKIDPDIIATVYCSYIEKGIEEINTNVKKFSNSNELISEVKNLINYNSNQLSRFVDGKKRKFNLLPGTSYKIVIESHPLQGYGIKCLLQKIIINNYSIKIKCNKCNIYTMNLYLGKNKINWFTTNNIYLSSYECNSLNLIIYEIANINKKNNLSLINNTPK